jgi:hypothetical protein
MLFAQAALLVLAGVLHARAAIQELEAPAASSSFGAAVVLLVFLLFTLTFAMCLKGMKTLAENRPKTLQSHAVLSRPTRGSKVHTVINF